MNDLIKRAKRYLNPKVFGKDAVVFPTLERNIIAELVAHIEQEPKCEDVRLNPRFWTKEMHDAWHKNIPDMMKAFEALRNIKP